MKCHRNSGSLGHRREATCSAGHLLKGGESATEQNTIGFAVLNIEKEGVVSTERVDDSCTSKHQMAAVANVASLPSSLVSTKELCMTWDRNSSLPDIPEKSGRSRSK